MANSIKNIAAKKAAKNAVDISLKQALKTAGTKTILNEALKKTPKMLTTTFKANAKVMPQHFVRSMTDKQLSTGVYMTDAGDAVFTKSENLALSFFKAIGD
ncbi:hypothetical protein IJ531_02230, partial [bacterium]|nr:hypothetical protein [bacterium]